MWHARHVRCTTNPKHVDPLKIEVQIFSTKNQPNNKKRRSKNEKKAIYNIYNTSVIECGKKCKNIIMLKKDLFGLF